MTGKEALDAGFEICRTIVEANPPEGRKAITALRKEFNTDRFHNLPPDQGHLLYKRVKEVARQLKIDV
jgi:hypothetical protein